MAATSPAPPRGRDAARSREALLDAAERLFSARGFGDVSVQEIGEAAGLSRGTPSYFFGSKDGLYAAVLDRLFAARDGATEAAFAPVLAWAADHEADEAALRRALARAATDYLTFLQARPAFVRLVGWEDLAGGTRLRAARPTASNAMTDAFAAVRRTARRRGTAPFAVDDAVLVFVTLTFSLLAMHDTFLARMERDLANPAVRRRHVKLVVEQMMALVSRPR